MNNNEKIIDIDMKRKEKLITKIRECDSLHNKCDYLLEHNDCDDLIEYIDKLKWEKQQLISFLKDKIKNYEEDIENSKPYLEHKELFQQVQNDIHTSKCIINNLQEVLDFVNKGGDIK